MKKLLSIVWDLSYNKPFLAIYLTLLNANLGEVVFAGYANIF